MKDVTATKPGHTPHTRARTALDYLYKNKNKTFTDTNTHRKLCTLFLNYYF